MKLIKKTELISCAVAVLALTISSIGFYYQFLRKHDRLEAVLLGYCVVDNKLIMTYGIINRGTQQAALIDAFPVFLSRKHVGGTPHNSWVGNHPKGLPVLIEPGKMHIIKIACAIYPAVDQTTKTSTTFMWYKDNEPDFHRDELLSIAQTTLPGSFASSDYENVKTWADWIGVDFTSVDSEGRKYTLIVDFFHISKSDRKDNLVGIDITPLRLQTNLLCHDNYDFEAGPIQQPEVIRLNKME